MNVDEEVFFFQLFFFPSFKKQSRCGGNRGRGGAVDERKFVMRDGQCVMLQTEENRTSSYGRYKRPNPEFATRNHATIRGLQRFVEFCCRFVNGYCFKMDPRGRGGSINQKFPHLPQCEEDFNCNWDQRTATRRCNTFFEVFTARPTLDVKENCRTMRQVAAKRENRIRYRLFNVGDRRKKGWKKFQKTAEMA